MGGCRAGEVLPPLPAVAFCPGKASRGMGPCASLSPSWGLGSTGDGRQWKPKGFQGLVAGCCNPKPSPRTEPEQRTANSVHAAGQPNKTAWGLLCLQAARRRH